MITPAMVVNHRSHTPAMPGWCHPRLCFTRNIDIIVIVPAAMIILYFMIVQYCIVVQTDFGHAMVGSLDIPGSEKQWCTFQWGARDHAPKYCKESFDLPRADA